MGRPVAWSHSHVVFAMNVCATIVARAGPGYLKVLVILFFWNAAKFAWMAVLGPLPCIRSRRQQKVST